MTAINGDDDDDDDGNDDNDAVSIRVAYSLS